MSSLANCRVPLLFGCVLFLSFPLVSTARAQSYLGVQVGATLPQGLTSIRGDENLNFPEPPGSGDLKRDSSVSDATLDPSVMYGLKLGHYFRQVPWIGLETEAFTATPDAPRQIITIKPPGVAPFQEKQLRLDFRVTTLAFNVVARYPGERWQPYAGVGLGLFFAELHGSGRSGILLNDPDAAGTGPRVSTSSTRPGLNTQMGLRYLLTERWALFGEWKFNHADFEFDRIRSLTNVSATYDAHHLVVGLSFQFGGR